MSNVTIVMPCYRRAKQLDRTLASIASQDYPGIESIVVEDGNDGETEQIAHKWGARYIRHERSDVWPTFQSISLIRNIGIKAAATPVIILQDGEMMYETTDAVRRLVDTLDNRPDKVVAAGTVRKLDKDGEFECWFTHPVLRCGSAGGSPRAILRQTVLDMGGFEERFFGYGFEDNYFCWLIDKRTTTIYEPDVLVAHLWHEPTGGSYEHITGSSNQALVHRLTTEISWHGYPDVANLPLPIPQHVSPAAVKELIHAGIARFNNKDWQEWAKAYISGDRGDENASDVARYKAASANPHDASAHIAMRAAQAIWALEWIDRCDLASTQHPERHARIEICRENFMADASLSVEVGNRVLKGEEVRTW